MWIHFSDILLRRLYRFYGISINLPGITESAEIISFNKSLGSVPLIIWFWTQANGPAVGFHSAPDSSDIPDITDNLNDFIN